MYYLEYIKCFPCICMYLLICKGCITLSEFARKEHKIENLTLTSKHRNNVKELKKNIWTPYRFVVWCRNNKNTALSKWFYQHFSKFYDKTNGVREGDNKCVCYVKSKHMRRIIRKSYIDIHKVIQAEYDINAKKYKYYLRGSYADYLYFESIIFVHRLMKYTKTRRKKKFNLDMYLNYLRMTNDPYSEISKFYYSLIKIDMKNTLKSLYISRKYSYDECIFKYYCKICNMKMIDRVVLLHYYHIHLRKCSKKNILEMSNRTLRTYIPILYRKYQTRKYSPSNTKMIRDLERTFYL